jgi:hypothetical protein
MPQDPRARALMRARSQHVKAHVLGNMKGRKGIGVLQGGTLLPKMKPKPRADMVHPLPPRVLATS